MRSGTFSHDPHSHAIVVGSSVSSSVVRGVRVRTSMSTKWHDPKLVLITDLQEKEKIERDSSECLCFALFISRWLDDAICFVFCFNRYHSYFSECLRFAIFISR